MKTLLLFFLLASLTAHGQGQPTKGGQPAPCTQPTGDLCFKNTCEKAITVSVSRNQVNIKTIDLLKGQEGCMYDLRGGGYTYVAREKTAGSGWNSQGAAGLPTPFISEVKVKECEEVKIEIPNFLE